MRAIFRGVAGSVLALGVALFSGSSWANTVSANVADYNAAQVTLKNGTVTVPTSTALATYNVTTTALAIGSSFTVTLPSGFTFGSNPSLAPINPATSTFTLTSGGNGSQSATFAVATAALAVGQRLSLATFTVNGATALETPIPVANALQLSMQAIGTDATPLTVGAFASEPGAQMLTVGAIQLIDTSPPSLGTLFLSTPDTPLAVLNVVDLSAQTVDAATGTVPVLSPSGSANALASTDTAVVTVTGSFASISSAFVSTTSDCLNPILTGTVTPTSLTFPDVPIGPQEFGCVTANGTTQLQQDLNGFSTTFAPGPSVDFLVGPVNNEFVGLFTFAGPPLPEVMFSPSAIPPDGATQSLMTVTVTNPQDIALFTPGPALTGVAFSDMLPAGLQSVGAVVSDTCGGSGSFTATGFSKSGISLASGASCVEQINVIAPLGTAAGPYVDTTSTVISNEDTPGGPGSGTLTVTNDPIFTLSVAESGAGSGTVTSSPSGINCSATSNQCAGSFASGTSVTLTAAPAPFSSSFTGWSGAGCSGTGTCTVTMNQAQSVTASFAQVDFTLSVTETGGGTGLVSSSPPGIVCGPSVNQCSTSYVGGSTVMLSAVADAGSTFAGWSGGGCSGTGTCSVTLSANETVKAAFAGSGTALVAAVLPDSRSVAVGATATAFADMINTGTATGTACSISPATSVPATFLYQTTDLETNTLTGSPNTPVAIAPGGIQSFLIAFTPTAAFDATQISFNFECGGVDPAPSTPGVNTLNLSASTTPVPDIVALAASADPGHVDIPGATGTGVFAVATVNLGVDATITVSANTGAATLPVTLTVCQTNPSTGICLATPSATVSTDIPANATPTFGIFVTGSAAVADMPGVNRIFVTFTDAGGVLRGETSVAVRTQ